jgi:aryl-alcohol dehydrogenase-like predicted oxidoreductase
MSARLVLGTAQFGLDYGIVNTTGKVSPTEIGAILSLARRSGFVCLDTAAAYGDAESVLGRFDISDLRVVTKLSLPRDIAPEQIGDVVMAGARRSLGALRCQQLEGLLLHSADELAGPRAPAVHSALVRVREAGLARRIGVSVYSCRDIAPIISHYPVDLVQLPLSVLDQKASAWLPRLIDSGVAVHVRSVFLQGLLLQPPDNLPPQMAALAAGVSAFHKRAITSGLSPLEAALAFVRDLAGIEGVVVGVASLNELQEIVKAFVQPVCFDAIGLDMSHLPETDPRTWTQA